MEPEISIVIPVYNSSGMLAELTSRIDRVFENTGMRYQLILVDDGSADESWNTIENLKKDLGDKLKGIKLAKNFGQHNALCCGFMYADAPMVMTMDDDLQHIPEEIPKLIREFKTSPADVVYGIPKNSRQPAIRKLGSSFITRISQHYKSNNQGGSAFRLMRKTLVEKITLNHSHNFVYIDAIINWYTSNIRHVMVEYGQRQQGKSGYSLARLTGLYFNMVINYSAGPLKAMIWVGFISAFLSFLVGLNFIYRKLMYDVPMGYTSIIVAILFGTGLILLALGIIGQYIYRIYQLQYRKPAFSIQTTV